NYLLAPDLVHLLADDVLDLEPGALAERKYRVVACRELADESGPHEQPMADCLGPGRSIAQRGNESLRPPHIRARVTSVLRTKTLRRTQRFDGETSVGDLGDPSPTFRGSIGVTL